MRLTGRHHINPQSESDIDRNVATLYADNMIRRVKINEHRILNTVIVDQARDLTIAFRYRRKKALRRGHHGRGRPETSDYLALRHANMDIACAAASANHYQYRTNKTNAPCAWHTARRHGESREYCHR